MMGLSAAMTAAAFEPRRARISAASLLRSRLTAALLGLVSSLPLRYRRTLNPRKSNPSVRWTILVLPSLKTSPRGASHSASCALTRSACCLE